MHSSTPNVLLTNFLARHPQSRYILRQALSLYFKEQVGAIVCAHVDDCDILFGFLRFPYHCRTRLRLYSDMNDLSVVN